MSSKEYTGKLNKIDEIGGYIQVGASYFKCTSRMIEHAKLFIGRRVKIEYLQGDTDLNVKSIVAAS